MKTIFMHRFLYMKVIWGKKDRREDSSLSGYFYVLGLTRKGVYVAQMVDVSDQIDTSGINAITTTALV